MMRFESGLSNLTTAAVMLVACQGLGGNGGEAIGASRASTGGRTVTHLETATFAGGCFWCMEAPFERINGVVEVLSGYAGGPEHNPTYTEVASGQTGHTESIQIRFDPTRVRYADLLQLFWRQIDPTDGGGQFVDRGSQYRTAIFVHGEQQRRVAEASKMKLADSGRYDRPIVTEIVEAGRFYAAEAYHQDFYKKSPARYHGYRRGSGRDQYLDEVWGDRRDYVPEPAKQSPTTKYSKPDDAEIKARLSPLQLEVTQHQGTEPPFSNEYWDNKKVGIYVDIVSGEPLFSSRDKFDSGTGWPSFTRPLESSNIVEEGDNRLMMKRTEVRSKHGDSHLGHLFPDGPAPTGLRYCINSASLRFISREDLNMEGYDRFSTMFD